MELHRVTVLVLLLALGWSRAAAADPPIEEARRAAKEGVELYNRNAYEDALVRFRRADAIFPAPQNKIYAARCLSKLVRLLEARTVYDSIIDQVLADDAPASFRETQAVALQERAVLKQRIPTLSVALTGPELDGVEVVVDGKVVSKAELASMTLDPGAHVVVVKRSGDRVVTTKVTLAEGEQRSVSIEAPAVAAAGSVTRPPSAGPASGRWIGPGLLLGVGGAGLAAAAVAGAWSLAEVNAIRDRCTADGHCPRADADRAAGARAGGDASTALFVIGGASAIAGFVWLGVSQPWIEKGGVSFALSPAFASISGSFE